MGYILNFETFTTILRNYKFELSFLSMPGILNNAYYIKHIIILKLCLYFCIHKFTFIWSPCAILFLIQNTFKMQLNNEHNNADNKIEHFAFKNLNMCVLLVVVVYFMAAVKMPNDHSIIVTSFSSISNCNISEIALQLKKNKDLQSTD